MKLEIISFQRRKKQRASKDLMDFSSLLERRGRLRVARHYPFVPTFSSGICRVSGRAPIHSAIKHLSARYLAPQGYCITPQPSHANAARVCWSYFIAKPVEKFSTVDIGDLERIPANGF
jgi:hypothetical protein